MSLEYPLFQLNRRGFTDRLGGEIVEDKIIGGLADKYSILMNLRVLREMARCSVRSIGQRKFDTISHELLTEIEDLETPPEVIARRKRRERRRRQKEGLPPQSPSGRAVRIKKESVEEPDDDETVPDMPSFDF